VERELVLRLASVLWRLRRARGIESALFAPVAEHSRKHENQLSRDNLDEGYQICPLCRRFKAHDLH
jgi:hypothetical protein